MRLPLLFPLACLTLSLAAGPIEEEPASTASALLSPEVFARAGGGLDEEVPVHGFLGRFHLRTEFGAFRCDGSEMVALRIHEANALREIEKLSRSKLFADAAKQAVVQPIQSAVKVVKDPVGAVKAVPQGVSRVFGSVAKGVKAVGRTAENAVKGELNTGGDKGPKREDKFGYNKARNRWAAEFKVDPYTTNPVLAGKLSDLASMSFTTETIAGFGLGAVAAPLTMIGTVDEVVLTKPAAEVKGINSGKLKSLTGNSKAVSAFVSNRWFTPTLQSRFARALGQLGSVKKLAVTLEAAKSATSEEEARFYCRIVEGLATAHTGAQPLAELRQIGRVPVGLQADGTVILSMPVDQLSWTETAQQFTGKLPPGTKVVLVTQAVVTPRAREELTALGWTLP